MNDKLTKRELEMTLQMSNSAPIGLFSRAALCLAVILTLYVAVQSLLPTGAPPAITHFDKIMHFVAYGILAALWHWGLPRQRVSLIVIALISVGVAIELAQHFMALGRTGSWLDSLANSAGALCGGISAALLTRLMARARGKKISQLAP